MGSSAGIRPIDSSPSGAEPDRICMKIPHSRVPQIDPADRFLVSFPRSGATWLRNLVADAAVHARDGYGVDIPPEELIPNLHDTSQSLSATNASFYFGSSRIVRTHDVDTISGHRSIYLFRSPADVLVSQYFTATVTPETSETAATLGVDGYCLQQLESWGHHIASALRCGSFDDVLFIPYERLIADTAETLSGALLFLGLTSNAESIAYAIEKNRFDRLAEAERETASDKAPIYRKGVVGDARQHVRAEVLAAIEKPGNRLYQMAVEVSNKQFTVPFHPNLTSDAPR